MKTCFLRILFLCLLAPAAHASTYATRGGWADVHLWRYWESRNGKMVEKLLILNEREKPVRLTVRVDTVELVAERIYTVIDSAFGVVGGPWTIPARGYRIFRMPRIAVRDANGYLFRFTRADTSLLARMNIAAARPQAPARGDWALTTGEVDGGHSWKDVWWEQKSPVALSGERTTARLRVIAREWPTRTVHAEQFVLVLHWEDSVMHGRKPLELVRAACDRRLQIDSTASPGFPYKWVWPKGTMPATGFAFTLPNEPHGTQETLTFDFVVDLPAVASPELCRLAVFSSSEEISLPFVVLPRQKRGK